MFKPVENFYEFICAKLITISRKQNLKEWRKCSRIWQFCTLFYTFTIKRGGMSYMKSIGGRLRRQKKEKQRKYWNWIKSNTIDTYFFYTGGYRLIVNN